MFLSLHRIASSRSMHKLPFLDAPYLRSPSKERMYQNASHPKESCYGKTKATRGIFSIKNGITEGTQIIDLTKTLLSSFFVSSTRPAQLYNDDVAAKEKSTTPDEERKTSEADIEYQRQRRRVVAEPKTSAPPQQLLLLLFLGRKSPFPSVFCRRRLEGVAGGI